MSTLSVGTTAQSIAPQSTAPATPNLSAVALQKTAHAKFLKTGIDKDAAIGDPDHDGSGKKASVSAPQGQSVASSVPTVNGVSLLSGGSASSASGIYSRAQGKTG